MKRLTVVTICAFTAAILRLFQAGFYTFLSIPELRGYFSGLGPETYWANRLTATQLLAAQTHVVVAIVMFLGAYLIIQSEPVMRRIGTWLLLISLLPTTMSIASILILTPTDSGHVVLPVLSGLLAVMAVWLRAGQPGGRI